MEWLNRLFDYVLDFLPTFWQVLPNEDGVRVNNFLWWSWTSKTPPGWYIFWPIFQTLIKVEVTPQVVDLRSQSILRPDGKSIVVSGAIRYRIADAWKAILDVQDFDDSIVSLALGTIAQSVSRSTEINDISLLQSELRAAMAKECSGWGVKIEAVYITDLDRVKSIRLLGVEKYD